MRIVVERDSIGGRIEAARKATGLTQTELAVRIFGDEKKRDLIKHWEIGDRQIKSDNLAMLCKALGVSADFIIGLEEDHTPDVNTKKICKYIGLSSATIEWLHDCRNIFTRSFYKIVFDSIIRNIDYGAGDVPRLIYKAAQARVKSQSKEKDSPVSEEVGLNFAITADEAEEFFMYRAKEELERGLDLTIDLLFCEAVDKIKRKGTFNLWVDYDNSEGPTDSIGGDQHGND